MPLELHRAMQGWGALEGDASLELPFVGDGVVVLLWCHAWSGRALVSVDDGSEETVELWSPVGGFVRVVRTDLEPGAHRLRIRRAGTCDPRSQGDQVIFYEAAVVERL